MPFASGSVTFRTFRVIGQRPKIDKVLEGITQHRMVTSENAGTPEEVGYGWAGARHILDDEISNENNVFADSVIFSLRIDTNKVPGDVKKAWREMEEAAVAAGNPSGFLSKLQKREVKDTIRKKVDEAVKYGAYRRTRCVPLLWDIDRDVVYCNASGKSLEFLHEIFERSFGLTLSPVDSEAIAMMYTEALGQPNLFEEARPTRFVLGPEGEQSYPEYPWAAKGSSPRNYFGNEFLLWLWHHCEQNDGLVKVDNKEIAVFIDRSLDLECAYGQTGKESLRGDGPSRSPEAKSGLLAGKMPRKAHMLIDYGGATFSLTLNPETMTYSGVKLPEVEDAETPRVLFEERIGMLNDLRTAVNNLYHAFITVRFGTHSWTATQGAISNWIKKGK